jgi:hypothetical protein
MKPTVHLAMAMPPQAPAPLPSGEGAGVGRGRATGARGVRLQALTRRSPASTIRLVLHPTPSPSPEGRGTITEWNLSIATGPRVTQHAGYCVAGEAR